MLRRHLPVPCRVELGAERHCVFVCPRCRLKHKEYQAAYHSLRNDSTEPCSGHDDVRLSFHTLPHDLPPDMFSFSITIRPYHEFMGSPGFILEVLRDRSGVLPDFGDDGGLEEIERVARGPLGVLEAEVMLQHMTSYGCYCESGVDLRVVKVIVPYILVAALPLWRYHEVRTTKVCKLQRTVVDCPPLRICVIDLAIEGFSATQSTRVGRIESGSRDEKQRNRKKWSLRGRQSPERARMGSSRVEAVAG